MVCWGYGVIMVLFLGGGMIRVILELSIKDVFFLDYWNYIYIGIDFGNSFREVQWSQIKLGYIQDRELFGICLVWYMLQELQDGQGKQNIWF